MSSRVRHSGGRRRRKHEEHTNHEAWAVPYGDLVTLLLAFFVVMYAISSVNAGKYRVLSDSLFAAFRGAPRSMEPIQVGDKQAGTGADMRPTVQQQAVLEGKAMSSLAPIPVSTGYPKGAGDPAVAQAAAAAAALSHVADEVEHAMDSLVKKNMITVRRSDFWIEVEMRADILFPSGSARLADSAIPVIEQLGDVLAPYPNSIRVEGHTDNKPIKTAVFYSNWELSAARAGSVVRVLAGHGVGPSRLAVVGYGDQRPLKPNDTADGRNANRRVVVVILSTDLMRQSTPGQSSAPGQNPAQAQDSGQTPTLAAPGEAAQIPGKTPGTNGSAAPSTNASAPGTANTAAQSQNTNGVTLSPMKIIGTPKAGDSSTDEPAGTAIASPADSPQAVPAPAATAPTTQHNTVTGTEPAP